MCCRIRVLWVALLGFVWQAHAAEVDVLVKDSAGLPAADSVGSLLPADAASLPSAGNRVAAIDQRGLKFIPHVLAVQAGTPVEFPNSDQVRHQVYSFSAAKKFELRLYKGKPTEPVVFDKSGVVVLGCNIHDWMLGYIVVVDTPYFATSDASGHLKISNVPAGSYRLQVWNSRVRDNAATFSEPLQIAQANIERTVSLALGPPEPDAEPPSELEQKFRKYQNSGHGP